MFIMTKPVLFILILIPFLTCFNCENQNFKVIIVGAGSSGIAAARKLLLNGVTNIKIFESEPRYGGRIRSVLFGDKYIDLGAEWCHGEINNTVYELAKDYDILKSTNFGTIQYITSDGQLIEQELTDVFNDFSENFDEKSDDLITKENESFEDVLIRGYEEILDKYKDDSKKLKLCVEALSTIEAGFRGLEASFNLKKLRAKENFQDLEGDHFNWDGRGYKTILEIMMQTYPDNHNTLPFEQIISLNTKVTKIDYSGYNNNKATVFTENSDEGYQADHVIFTPSLGVLKEKLHTLFKPKLPAEKELVIRELGFDAIMKIAMRFKYAWWDGEFIRTNLVWTLEDRANLGIDPKYGPPYDDVGESWLCSVFSLTPAENNPKVLIAWVTGEIIMQLEVVNDTNVIKRGMTHLLNKFFGEKYEVLAPEEVMLSKWFNSESFHGSYSYVTTSFNNLTVRNPQAILAEPLGVDGKKVENRKKPLLLFAGEATHTTHHSTVHGAIETGYRAADEILRYYNMVE